MLNDTNCDWRLHLVKLREISSILIKLFISQDQSRDEKSRQEILTIIADSQVVLR